jgi:hypothetical protein
MLEKQIEDVIYEGCVKNPDEMRKRGFCLPLNCKIYRQIRLGEYGIADIISIGKNENGELSIYVYELKKDFVNVGDLLQLTRYMGGVVDWLLSVTNYDYNQKNNIDIKGFLVAPQNNLELLGGWLDWQSNIGVIDITLDPFEGMVFKKIQGLYYGHNLTNVSLEIPDEFSQTFKKTEC